MLSKRLAMRAVPALMMLVVIAACSRAPEEPAPVAPSTEVIVIATEESRHQFTFPPEQASQPAEPQVGYPEDAVYGGGSAAGRRDEVDEDSTDKPNNDLAENPDECEYAGLPYPNGNSSTSAIGIGGGAGGGGGRGGQGGYAHRRANGGGPKPQESACTAAPPDWLSAHQNKDGYWSADKFNDDSTRAGATHTYNIEFVKTGDAAGDVGSSDHDIFVTSLALLVYAGAGFDHKEGKHRATCRNAILYLRKVQENDGRFGPKGEHHMRRHAVATMAMAEIYGLSGDQVIKPIVDKAIEYLLKTQFKGSGWGNEDADLLTTTWCVLALKSAKLSGLEFDPSAAFGDAQKFLDLMLIKQNGYPFPRYSLLSDQTPGSTGKLPLNDAAWVIASLFTGQRNVEDRDIRDLARVMTEKGHLPIWEEGKLDFQYWYFASLALYQVGGAVWKTWEKAFSDTLLNNQRGFSQLDKDAGRTDPTRFDEHGSWDAVDVWSPLYGRVYSTAINHLSLEVHYRYLRLEESKKKTPKADSDKDGLPDVEEFAKAQAFTPDLDCGGLRARSGGVVVGDFPLARTVVNARVSGNVAGTTVTQTFTNPYTQPIEAMYTFPLPGDCAINDFAMRIGDRRIIGMVRPREEALVIYKEARARGQTASLLTQNRPNVFTQSVANIEVGGEIKISFSYYQSLKYESDRYEYVFPLTLGERYKSGGADPVSPETEPTPEPTPEPEARDGDGVEDPEDFDVRTLPQGQRSGMDVEISVDINAGLPIDVTRLRSMQHEILVSMTNTGRALVELAQKDAIPNRDFVLRWGFAGETPGVALHTHSDSRGNFLNLQMQPQVDPRDADITPREITFILDNSGSMSGSPAQMSREVINRVLDHLHPDDTFNIVYFAGGNDQLFEGPVANTTENKKAARKFLRESSAGGGTEMLKGLQRALNAEHDKRYLQMYAFLTDGYVSGEHDILKAIDDQGQDARFFSFGIGSAVNRFLIDGIAEHGKGKAIYCLPRDGDYDDAAVQEFFDAIDRPVLCDIDIDWGGLEVEEAYPEKINDLFAGQPLSLTARYSGQGKHTIHVRGRVGARYVEYPIKLDLSLPDANPAIAAIWARQKIGGLENKLLNFPGDPTIIQAITQTALDYQLMSAYTSFVAVDESRVVGNGEPLRVWQPVEMPENVLYQGDDVAVGEKTFRIGSWGLVVGQTQDGRVIVVKVEDGSAAAEAGMKPGQIIKKINGVNVGDLAKLEKVLLQSEAKVDVETSIKDEGKEVDAAFKLPEATAEKK